MGYRIILQVKWAGNPFIFSEIAHRLGNNDTPKVKRFVSNFDLNATQI